MSFGTKFLVKAYWCMGMKIYTNELCHKTKMTDMPIYDEHEKIVSRINRSMALEFDMLRCASKYYQDCLNNDLGLTLTYFTLRSNLGA